MPADPRVEQLKSLLEEMNAADITEDADYETQIATATAQLAVVTADRDVLQAERETIIADLIAARDSLSARITALGG